MTNLELVSEIHGKTRASSHTFYDGQLGTVPAARFHVCVSPKNGVITYPCNKSVSWSDKVNRA